MIGLFCASLLIPMHGLWIMSQMSTWRASSLRRAGLVHPRESRSSSPARQSQRKTTGGGDINTIALRSREATGRLFTFLISAVVLSASSRPPSLPTQMFGVCLDVCLVECPRRSRHFPRFVRTAIS